jgi:hypothetical protein
VHVEELARITPLSQNCRGEWHDQGWWHNHYNRIVLISAWRLFVLLEIPNRDRYGSLNSPAL